MTYLELATKTYQLLRQNLVFLWTNLIALFATSFLILPGVAILIVVIAVSVGIISSQKGSLESIIGAIVLSLLGFLTASIFFLAATIIFGSGQSYMIKQIIQTGKTEWRDFLEGIKRLWKKISQIYLLWWLILLFFLGLGGIIGLLLGIIFKVTEVQTLPYSAMPLYVLAVLWYSILMMAQVFLFMWVPAVVLEEKGVMEALKSSLVFARRNLGFLIVLWLIFLSVIIILSFATSLPAFLILAYPFLVMAVGSGAGMLSTAALGLFHPGGIPLVAAVLFFPLSIGLNLFSTLQNLLQLVPSYLLMITFPLVTFLAYQEKSKSSMIYEA